ncbi:MAG: DUF4296 domain-containing protein [Cyclobacteriaceae bacterium]
MRFAFLVVVLLVTLSSCKREVTAPENLLDKTRMVDVLIDIHLLEAKLDALSVDKDSSTVLYRAYEQQIFEKHQISSDLYRESYQWHFNHLHSLNDIYSIVVDSLMLRQQARQLER